MTRTASIRRPLLRNATSRRAATRFSLERLEERRLLSTGLVAAYSFDEGSGTVLHDSSGNGHNGSISGATWTTAGKYGDALAFNGTGSLVTIPNAASLQLTTGMTLEAWVDPSTVTGAWRDVIYKGNDNYYLEGTSTRSKEPAAGATLGSADVDTYGTAALTANTWAFLTETYNGSTLALYVNGTLVSSLAHTGNIATSTDALQIGGDSTYGQYFAGKIDNVRIYNTALSQSQIQSDMNTPVAPAVTSYTPASGATGVATNTAVTATFNEAMLASSITAGDFTLKSASGSSVSASVSYNSGTDTATLTPSSHLANSTTYTASISGAQSSGNTAMSGTVSWSFTTGPAPAVTSKTPASGATGVATSTAVTATFNEAVQSSTISFVLKSSSGTAVAATVSYNTTSFVVTLTPNASLANSTTYTATLSGAKDAAGDPMSGPVTWSFTTGAARTNTGLVAAYSFDEGSGTVLHDASGNGHNGSISGATWTTAGKYGDALAFNGTGSLVTIPNAASLQLTTGMTLEAWVDPSTVNNAWRDVVYKGNDNYFLEATSTAGQAPAAGATMGSSDVDTAGKSALATGTWAFLTETYNGSTLALYVNGAQVSSLAQAGKIATSTDALQIGGDSIYGQYFAGKIDNVRIYNTALTQAQIQADMNATVAPAVTSYTPASGATAVATNTAVTVTFNEAMLASSITAGDFTLKSASGATVAAAVSYNSGTNTATLTPSLLLSNSTKYTASISGAENSAGTPMTAAESWSVTTGPAPAVTAESPASGATGVATSTAVTATFNEAVQSSTISFKLTSSSGSSVPATVTYNSSTFVATLTPSSALSNSTKYTATISGAKDAAGDPMAAPVSWSFTTAAAAAPVVSSHTPASGATGVATNAVVTATFNLAMLVSSITGSDFTLKTNSGSTVTATVSFNSSTNTATLTPSSRLGNSTTYTANISGVVSLLGIVIGAPFSWSFTTGPAPAVTSEAPASGATGVPTPSTVTATFNEAVQSGTISFALKDSSGTTVPATVSYNPSTLVVTLTPSASLAYSMAYTATVSGALDAAGDHMAGASRWSFTTTTSGSGTNPSTEPLLSQSNLQYVGAFRVPEGTIGASQFDYGGTAIAFNPANNSLFAVGHPYDQAIAEIKIPSTIVNSTNLNNLTTATMLQPFSSILNRIPNNPSSLSTGGGYEAIGGLMVDNGQLIGTAYNTYDSSGSVMLSHFVMSSLNLASANVSGLYQVGTMGGGFVGGYMTPVPSEWQSALGAPDLTGQAALNVISRTSYGPDAFGFDPANLGSGGITPDIPYVYYDQNHTTLGAWDSNAPTLFNGTVGGDNNTGFGVAFVPGTRSVLFFSGIGTGNFYYGEASGANDPNRTFKGCHSVGGNYAWQVWAYDANDLVAVRNGEMNPWDVKPYATWNFNFPLADGTKYMGGVAFDPSSGRLYFSELNEDTSNPYTYTPLIQVFQVTPFTPAQASGQSAARPAAISGASTPLSAGSPSQTVAPVNGTSGLSSGTAAVGAAGQAITVPTTDVPQGSLLGTVPPEVRGKTQGAERQAAQSSVMSRANTLLQLSNPRSTRVRTGKELGRKSPSLFGSEFEQ